MEAPKLPQIAEFPSKEETTGKSQLNIYCQKAGIPLPSYYTVNEGYEHAPQFRSSVTFGGAAFTSPETFSTKKAALNHVAKYALDGILASIASKDASLIVNDNVFSKAMLNEFAVKMKMELPKYETSQPEATHPAFVTCVTFDGKVYTGPPRRNKKEAERQGACVVINKILESDTDRVMSCIIRSKSSLCTPIYQEAAAKHVHYPTMPISSKVGSDAEKVLVPPETGNSLVGIQPRAISYELPPDGNRLQIEGLSVILPLSNVMFHQTGGKRKKENKGKSLAKKANTQQPQSELPKLSEPAEPRINEVLHHTANEEVPLAKASDPSKPNQEVLPASEVLACPSNL